jgi:hypothetical protein
MLDNESDSERAYKAATLFFLAKAFKSYQAVHLLCSAGFFQDGAVLSRTMFEIFLQVSYCPESEVRLQNRATDSRIWSAVLVQMTVV